MKRYAMYDAESYAEMQTSGNRSMVASAASDLNELLREGIYRILTPDETVALAEEIGPSGTIIMRPLMCGMPSELGWESLELFREKVLPRIRPT